MPATGADKPLVSALLGHDFEFSTFDAIRTPYDLVLAPLCFPFEQSCPQRRPPGAPKAGGTDSTAPRNGFHSRIELSKR